MMCKTIVFLIAVAVGCTLAVPVENKPSTRQDNCSLVPDKWVTFTCALTGYYINFSPFCYNHDRCYDACSGRAICDQRFLNDMLASCNKGGVFSGACRSQCQGIAYAYYAGVRAAGGFFYPDHCTTDKKTVA